MATSTRNSKLTPVSVEGMVAMAAVVVLLLLQMSAAWAGVNPADSCSSTPLVYPYWSIECFNPAVYRTQQYTLERPIDRLGLAPEWDETNSTYYVRLSDEPANYTLTYLTTEIRLAVEQQKDVIFVNTATNGRLAWRQEGDEYFLIETGPTYSDERFSFVQDKAVGLACPRIAGARCEAYNVLSFGSRSGLSPYEEDGAIYFKLSSNQITPFVVIRSGDTLNSAIEQLATEV